MAIDPVTTDDKAKSPRLMSVSPGAEVGVWVAGVGVPVPDVGVGTGNWVGIGVGVEVTVGVGSATEMGVDWDSTVENRLFTSVNLGTTFGWQ